jgi:hypothetical protein
MLETVYPVSSKSSSGIWSWIVDKLGLRREDAPSENFIADSIAFPWHLLNITEDDFLVADRKYAQLLAPYTLTFFKYQLD